MEAYIKGKACVADESVLLVLMMNSPTFALTSVTTRAATEEVCVVCIFTSPDGFNMTDRDWTSS